MVLLDSRGETVEISPEDIDSDFDIGFSEAGRSPVSQAQMRNSILQLSDKMLQLLQIADQGQGGMSVLATEMYKTIHEQFEFPNNLSIEYIQGQIALQGEQQQDVPVGAQPEEQAEAPPPEEEAEAQPQALEALEQMFGDNPEVMKVITDAKELPEDKQAEVVKLILESLGVKDGAEQTDRVFNK